LRQHPKPWQETLSPLSQPEFYQALHHPPKNLLGCHIIAEIKPSSPSAGTLQAQPDIDWIVAQYSPYASALSILTDEKFFGGNFDNLTRCASLTSIPLLCKEFILDPLQIQLARFHGAHAVLLIVKILDQDLLAVLTKTCLNLGMTPVIEVQNETELDQVIALSLKAPFLLLINNRNLDTFDIDLTTTQRLVSYLDKHAPAQKPLIISASGVNCLADLQQIKPHCHAVLVGTSLMRSSEPGACLKRWIDGDGDDANTD
jgi:indole-3-glycerol phosphate synthase